MTEQELTYLTRQQLVELAIKKKIKNYSRMSKAELIDQIKQTGLWSESQPTGTKPKTKGEAAVRHPVQQKEQPSSTTLDKGQERVEDAKYYMGPTEYQRLEQPADLPAGYGDNLIVALVRDPYWIYAYWEISLQAIQQAKSALSQKWGNARSILRVYDVTDIDFNGHNASHHFDIEIVGGANNWYINVGQPNRHYCIDIGLLTTEGQLYTLARSNIVATPRDSMSDIFDEEWMSNREDSEKMYALSGGFGLGAGSLELREKMQERFKMELASRAISSWGSGIQREKGRGFRFVLDTELIVYGATEPDATVTLQGKRINLRPDGTFSIRFALPDGEQLIPVTATSADNIETRTIIPTVKRQTERDIRINNL
jgi:hypothetical protein